MNRTVALSASAALVVRTLITHWRSVLVIGLLIWFAVANPDAVAHAVASLATFVEEVSR